MDLLNSNELANIIAQLMLAKKGTDVYIMDLQGLTTITDYFVICSAESDVQVKAIKDHITEQLRLHAVKPWHVEGEEAMHWVLLDFVDVVVHIFQPETRQFYSLERLWGDAKITEVTDEDETAGIH